jgi:hypothetical protein
MGRDVRVQPYAIAHDLHALLPGDKITRETPLTAGFRNLGQVPKYLLLFTIDQKDTVRWIAPAFVADGTDPSSTALPPSAQELVLKDSVVFDDLEPGPLRIVMVLTQEPEHVSQVERLPADGLKQAGLARQFASGEVREFSVQVAPLPGAKP